MKYSPIKELFAATTQKINSKVTACGWVKTRRDSKAGMSFIALSDGSTTKPLQVVALNTLPNYEKEILHLTAGCAIAVTGTLVASPAQGQSVELQADEVILLGGITNPESYPISPKRHTMEYLREHAHLRPRTNIIGALVRVQNQVAYLIQRFFQEQGFYWIHTPIITTSDCEGAGVMFRVTTLDLEKLPCKADGRVDYAADFFAREAFLTVSGQLNLESYCMSMSKVYTFGPTFRAENSNTGRHLAEFWMVEPEIAFANLNDLAELAEAMLKYVCRAVLVDCAEDLRFFAEFVDKSCIERLEILSNSEFARLEYSAAIELLQKSGKKFEYPVQWGLDLQSEHERFLTEELLKRPVAVVNYPKTIKSFYMRLNDDEKTVAAMDVLAPGIGEIIGGSQREERLDVLERRMSELKLAKEPYDWYLDLRRYGTVPHAGFGLGFERFVSYITGIANLRDVIPFPRVPKAAAF